MIDENCQSKRSTKPLRDSASRYSNRNKMQEAKEMIASVLLEKLYDTLSHKKPFNEKKYEEKLNELENDDWIFDDVHEALADENDEKLQARYKVYDAIIDNKSLEAVSVFLQIWDKIKKYIREEFYKIDSKGNQIKPEILDVDDKTNYKLPLRKPSDTDGKWCFFFAQPAVESCKFTNKKDDNRVRMWYNITGILFRKE
ncbi:MAG: hypothetical protein WBI07_10025 [Mobilitalea sp.]